MYTFGLCVSLLISHWTHLPHIAGNTVTPLFFTAPRCPGVRLGCRSWSYPPVGIHLLPKLSTRPGGASGRESACQCRRHKGHEFNPWGWEDPLEKELATHCSLSCLENSMDRGTWRATVHRVSELDTTEYTHKKNKGPAGAHPRYQAHPQLVFRMVTLK